jgi:ParB-like chromosome segregation protein Spo0J
MKIVEIDIDKVKPYDNNPRLNDVAVKEVIESIKNYGIQQPLVVDKDNIIIVGDTRYKVLKQMDFKAVPCVVADLPPEKAKAYRIADNKTNEFAKWDMEKLQKEFEEIDFYTGFSDSEIESLLEDMELMGNEEAENTKDQLTSGFNKIPIQLKKYVFTIDFEEKYNIFDEIKKKDELQLELINQIIKKYIDKAIDEILTKY